MHTCNWNVQIDSTTPAPWWRDSVCYQIYVRSFADGNGDGVGDLTGVRDRLPYLAQLGVDSVWLTPFYTSPQHDHGYDVANHRDVDPLFGTLEDFDKLVSGAHDLGLKVIVDLVPNHTSSEHPWFVAALAAAPGSPERERYVFRDGLGPDGSVPPNNWVSMFGGPAWTRVEDGQWYLDLFDSSQPDLNWWNPEVGDEFESILRFWLDRGVDGFRVDVAHGLYKPADLVPATPADKPPYPMWDQPEVHDVYRRWHQVLAEYDGDRMAVAEAWTPTHESMARYIRRDELQQTFNFAWLQAPWSAESFRTVIEESLAAVGLVGGTATWVLSNHDVVRHASRYGGGDNGLRRARAAVLTMMALPGSAYVYQGEELGLEQVDVHPGHREDPSFHRTAGEEEGRDGCRVPIPWRGQVAPFGFGPGEGQPWLPMPEWFASRTVEAQEADPASTLSFYRAVLAMRRDVALGLGHEVTMLAATRNSLAFRRGAPDGEGLVCAVNCGTASVPVPVEAGELLMTSGAELVDASGTGPTGLTRLLPPDTAAWFRAL